MATALPLSNNAPPDIEPLRERLDQQYAMLRERAEELLAAEARLPDTLTEETVGRATDFARQIKACIKEVGAAHQAEKREFLNHCNTCDSWKNGIVGPLIDLAGTVQSRLDAFAVAKVAAARENGETERAADVVRAATGMGGVLSAQEPIGFEIVDKKRAATSLWHLLDMAAVEKAAREYARSRRDQLRERIASNKQPVPGVRFFIKVKALVR